MRKGKITIWLLIVGIVLFGSGIFAKFSRAGLVTPVATPIGTPGQTLSLQHIISYSTLTASDCGGGGSCRLTRGEVIEIGQYLGGFMASWRNCDNWTVELGSNTMVCTDDGGLGNFVSAFAILVSNSNGKLFLLMPLKGTDIISRSIPGVTIPDPIRNNMLWTMWAIDVQAGPNYSYSWSGFIDGGCGSLPANGSCGQVALEHNFFLK